MLVAGVLQTHNMNFHDSNAINELFRERQLKSFTLGTPDSRQISRITRKEFSVNFN